MPNGKPGDHPLTDMLVHGMHPFPPDIESLLRQVLEIAPRFPDDPRVAHYYADQLGWEKSISDWEAGNNLDDGREALRAVLEKLRRGGPG